MVYVEEGKIEHMPGVEYHFEVTPENFLIAHIQTEPDQTITVPIKIPTSMTSIGLLFKYVSPELRENPYTIDTALDKSWRRLSIQEILRDGGISWTPSR